MKIQERLVKSGGENAFQVEEITIKKSIRWKILSLEGRRNWGITSSSTLLSGDFVAY